MMTWLDSFGTDAPGNRFLAVLADSGAKGILLMALAALAVTLMRRKSAAARHLVWALALVGLILIPALSLVMPRWQFPVLPRSAVHSSPLPAVAHAPVPIPARQSALPADQADRQPQILDQAASPIGASLPDPLEPPPAPPPAARAPLAVWLTLGWLAVALAVLTPLLVGLLAVGRMIRRATPLTEAPWPELIATLTASLGLRQHVRFLRSGERLMPMAAGLWRASILLPADANNWPDEKRRAVLLHELAHVKRRDCLTHALARAAVALHWFNPLAWVALRRMRIERERACDDLVLTAGQRPSAYANHLLEIARTMRSNALASATAITMARKSQIEGRLLAILDATRSRKAVSKRALGLGLIFLICAGSLLAMVKVTESKPFPIPSSLVGQWSGTSKGMLGIGKEQFDLEKAPCELIIAASGKISGKLGDARLLDLRMRDWHSWNYLSYPERFNYALEGRILGNIDGRHLDGRVRIGLNENGDHIVVRPFITDKLFDLSNGKQGLWIHYMMNRSSAQGVDGASSESEADDPAEKQPEVVAWSVILDEPLAQKLIQKSAALQAEEGVYKSYRINAEDLLDIVRAGKRDGQILFDQTSMGWLELDGKFFHMSPLGPYASHRKEWINENLTRFFQVAFPPFCQVERKSQKAHIYWHGPGAASVTQRGIADSDRAEASVRGEFSFTGDLQADEAVLGMAPMGKVLQWNPWHVIVAQCVALPKAEVAYFKACNDAAKWVDGGYGRVLSEIQTARQWQQQAPPAVSKPGTKSLRETDSNPAVRIVAIGRPAQWPYQWWNPDGMPVDGEPAWQMYAANKPLALIVETRGLDGHINYELRHQGAAKSNIPAFMAGASVLDEKGLNRIVVGLDDTEDDWKMEVRDILQKESPLELVVTTGVGPYTRVTAIREGETVDAEGGLFNLQSVKDCLPKNKSFPGSVVVDLQYDFDPAYEVNMVAVDSKGARSQPLSATCSGAYSHREKRRIYSAIQMDKSDIDHFEILKRPVQSFTVSGFELTKKGLPSNSASPAVSIADTWQASSPGGVEAQLVAIGDAAENGRWWKGDGLPTGRPEFLDKLRTNSYAQSIAKRQICFRLRGLPPQCGDVILRRTDYLSETWTNPATGDRWILVAYANQVSSQPLTLTLGIPSEPWETLVQRKASDPAELTTDVRGNPVVFAAKSGPIAVCSAEVYWRRDSTKENPWLDIDRAYRIMALTKDQSVALPRGLLSTLEGGSYSVASYGALRKMNPSPGDRDALSCTFGVPLEQVSEFAFQTTRYQWIEFPPAATEPTAATSRF